MNRIISIIMLGLSFEAFGWSQYPAYPDFEVPTEFWDAQNFVPAGYLEVYPVGDIEEALSKESKAKLACLFIAAEISSQKKYNQTHYMQAKVPIIQLLISNFSQVSQMPWEGKSGLSKGAISLTQIAGLLSPFYNCEQSLNKSSKRDAVTGAPS